MVEIKGKYITQPQRNIPVIAEVDVAVVGGGPAGLCAALASARNGAKTIIIEKDEFLGGQFTSPHSHYAGSNSIGMTFQSFLGKQIVAGLGWEIMTSGSDVIKVVEESTRQDHFIKIQKEEE